MTDGFTGVNIGKFKIDIDNVANSYKLVGGQLVKAIKEFFEEASRIWGSSKAREICRALFGPIADKITQIGTQTVNQLTAASNAGNIMAAANGAAMAAFDFSPLVTIFSGGVSSIGAAVAAVKDNIDGAVGMDVNQMLNDALPHLRAALMKVLQQLGIIPRTIALYDANGNLKSNFNTGVDKVKSLIEDIVNTISNKIETEAENEANTIIVAKGRAQGTLDQIM